MCFIIAAVFFSFERLYVDSGYYFFKLINNQKFQIEHSRFVLIFAQLPTYLGLKLNLNLQNLIIVYSLTPVFFNFLVSWLCLGFYENRTAALINSLSLFLGVKHCFFTPQFEFFYGFSFFILSFSVFNYYLKVNKNGYIHLLFFVIYCFLALTSHPSILFIFILFYIYLIFKEKWAIKYIFLFIGIVLFYLAFKNLYPSEYEISKINFVKEYIETTHLKEILSFYNIKTGVLYFVTHYFDILLLIIILLIINLRDLFSLVYIIISVFALLILIWCLQLPGISEYNRYNEQIYLPAVSLVLVFLLNIKLNKIWIFLFMCIFILRVNMILNESIIFKKRTQFISEISFKSQKFKESKFYLDSAYIKDKTLLLNWSLPFETIIFSSIHYSKTKNICTYEDFKIIEKNIKDNEYVFRRWEIFKIKILNKSFFKLENSKFGMLK